MEKDLRAAALDTLRKLADGREHTARENLGWDMRAVERLYKAGFVTGRDASDGDGPEFIKLAITQRGAEKLAEEIEKQNSPETRDARYYRRYPIRANIVVGTSCTLITAAVMWVLSLSKVCG